MENLRWIILLLGLVIVLVIYLFGRSRDKTKQVDLPEPVAADDMPSISTGEEPVEVKIESDENISATHEINHFDLDKELIEKVSASVDDVLPDVMLSGSAVKSSASRIKSEIKPEENSDSIQNDMEDQHPATDTEKPAQEYQDDLIIMHVRAKTAYFNGTELLQVINHQQLKFGDMNIYHAYDENDSVIFSMSNMVQPGHFEPDNISEMRTPGVILFMQLSLVNDPEEAFARMNHCAETLARELDGKLTAANQQIITDQTIEDFKDKATYFKKSTPV